MSRAGRANAAAFACSVVLTALAARGPSRITQPSSPLRPTDGPVVSRRVPLARGGAGIPDATGRVVPVRPYRRVVSTTILTDRLLLALCEPDRILAFSAAGARTSPWAYQLAGKATVEGLGEVEPLVALKPDLVLMSSMGAAGRAANLRAAGIQTFQIGELRGVATLLETAHVLADLLGDAGRGVRFARAFERRLRSVSLGIGNRPRRRAVYVAAVGPHLYGGTVGTSYHDVLTAAGLVDAAAGRFSGWPEYSAEQLLALAPEVIVTKEGMGATLCAHPGLDRLPACRASAGVVELPAGLLDEPGPAMLDAAEALYSAVYGR